MERIERDEVDGGAVVQQEFETVATEEKSQPRVLVFLTCLPGLIVGCDKGGEADEECEEAGVRSDAGNRKNHSPVLLRGCREGLGFLVSSSYVLRFKRGTQGVTDLREGGSLRVVGQEVGGIEPAFEDCFA